MLSIICSSNAEHRSVPPSAREVQRAHSRPDGFSRNGVVVATTTRYTSLQVDQRSGEQQENVHPQADSRIGTGRQHGSAVGVRVAVGVGVIVGDGVEVGVSDGVTLVLLGSSWC